MSNDQTIRIDPEFKSLIPPLKPEEYTGLEESIVKDGCRDALILWNDILIDGHNRYEICVRHNIPYKTVRKEFPNRDAVMLWMIDTQFSRRNLDAMERILLAQKKTPILERMALAKKSETAKVSNAERWKSPSSLGVVQLDNSEKWEEGENDPLTKEQPKQDVTAYASTVQDHASEPARTIAVTPTPVPSKQPDHIVVTPEKVPDPAPKPAPVIHVREEIAKMAGVSTGTVARFEQVQKKKPELIEDIRKGEMSINQAYQQVRKEEKRQARQEEIQSQIDRPKTSSHVDIFTTDKKYRVIYADPPWDYGDKQNIDGLGGAVKHYTTMPLDEICKLPVPAEDNAVLFLWVTSPMLEDSFKVIKAWGFRYKSSFVWDKVAHNMGHYNSVRHELLLIATRGSCTPDVPKLFDSVVSIERTEHSRKPKEFRDMIDTLYPIGERLEMFAREGPDGWDVWGNMA